MTSTFNEFLVTVKQYPFDVLTLSETWLKDNRQLLEYVSIPGYNFEFRNRESIRGGGVGAYIKESVQYKRRKDIEKLKPELENLWLEFQGKNKHSKLLLGVIYRSTRILSTQEWFDRIESLLGYLIVNWDGLLVLTGDMNIDMLREHDPVVRQYKELLQSFNLHQHIKKPTRVTSESKTLIDHIVSNHPSRITYTDVLPCSLVSDHDAPYACINVRIERFQPRFKYIRNEKTFNPIAFQNDFSTLPLSLIYSFADPNEQLDILQKFFNECLERHAPLRKVKVKVTRPAAPWLTNEIFQSLFAERDRLRKQAHAKTSTTNDWATYRSIRNQIKIRIRQAKKDFVKKALSSNKPKQTWRIIHRILKPSPKPLHFDPDNLNEYFVNTGHHVTGSIANSTDNLLKYIDSLTAHSDKEDYKFRLRNVKRSEIYQEICKLPADFSTGPNKIPAKYIKLVADDLAGPLTKIINDSINQSKIVTLLLDLAKILRTIS